ncbi:hypothetical protein GCM10022419_133610 [Nonomuraea rosea]|uniref:DUF1707 domain-containing protein n=1 Tax=Nonomuraea rosea TaxID=638574 RepID=A0ABP7A5D8_9ACTN
MTDDPDLRASDADRDRVAAMLGEALATGRLTSVEHADRLDVAYTAKTVGELVPITRDLPEVSASGLPAAVEQQVDGYLGLEDPSSRSEDDDLFFHVGQVDRTQPGPIVI